MPDEPMDQPPRGYTTQDVEPVKNQEPVAKRDGFLRRNWGKLTLLTLVAGPILVITLWTVIALSYSYSTGDRAGYVQKFSKKGWLCKTWEGELAMVNLPGQVAQFFSFTVRDDAVAAKVTAAAGKRVALTYEEHPGVPISCFGETRYFVTNVRTLE
ncbi:MAG TPA: hypothetical protein VH762_12785 [Gemmatimonadaceae bacterium]|jgi:hypothetical protein